MPRSEAIGLSTRPTKVLHGTLPCSLKFLFARGRDRCQDRGVSTSHFPEPDLAVIRRWCDRQSAKLPADELRIAHVVGGRSVDIGEERPPWRGGTGDEWTFMAVARLTYVKARNEWSLGVANSHGDFRRYTPLPTGRLATLLDEIDADPMCAFWG